MCVCVECMYRCECRGRAPPGAHPQQNSRWLQRASLCCHLNVVWQTIQPMPCFCYSMHVAIDSTHVMQMSCKCHANVMPMSCFYFSVHIMLLFLNPCLYFSMHVMFVFRYISDRTRVHGEQLVPGSTRAAVPCSVL